jgi:hypothetical protein
MLYKFCMPRERRTRGEAGRARGVLRELLAPAVGVLAALTLAEIALRVTGEAGWRELDVDRHEPTMNRADPTLGWRGREGRYVVPAHSPGEPATHVTILADGRRSSGADADDGRPDLVLLGGSFTHGVAISDAATWGWLLQERHPEVRVRNHGTSAYGTYQSLLVLEEVLAEDGPPPAFVLYGFIDLHEERNVAIPTWVEYLSLLARRGHVALPFATLGADGSLVRHAPQAHPSWPLRNRLATMAFAAQLHAQYRGRGRGGQMRPVTEALLLEMQRTCRARAVPCAVVLLWARDPEALDHYRRFLAANGVAHVDCARELAPELQVPGEGHPNARLNRQWADCIDAALGHRIDALAAPARRSEGRGADPVALD